MHAAASSSSAMSHSPASRQLTWSATPSWMGTPSPRRKSGAYRLRSRSGKHMASVGWGCARVSSLVLESERAGLGWAGLGLAPGMFWSRGLGWTGGA
ncbi:hypothetical protein BHYA_0206g00120 [Botrytis hyacinthi]|uniref:Uncharacterized protein n=1 Tax=Botrytis hyacinthi TaxID=278943 RepID=A0A4Z1GIE7_9HELO|nr:hypothetical protein BHYA_0206g00120 [Botrytis hyacinthi]